MCKLSDERQLREDSEQKNSEKKRKNLLTNGMTSVIMSKFAAASVCTL
jgi:hypothetical protein